MRIGLARQHQVQSQRESVKWPRCGRCADAKGADLLGTNIAWKPSAHTSIKKSIRSSVHLCLLPRLPPLQRRLRPWSFDSQDASLQKFAATQMIDLSLPTTDGRELRLSRHCRSETELQLPLKRMKLVLPPQRSPKIHARAVANQSPLK
jgi:hypothetical protein